MEQAIGMIISILICRDGSIDAGCVMRTLLERYKLIMSWKGPLEEWTRRLKEILKIDIILTSDFRIIINLDTDLILREIALVLNSYIHCCKLSLLQLLHSCLNHGSQGSQSKILS